ncbi:hypothetical protein TW95_gp1478 [Pandoravirus inopinatum]|uniref:Uncharacterized protein n=1 Tax=Pandoravirus inopinatum TaxID=1605721 RepID=A0A0B5JEL7_9VIRU|nr:hypothetical protein TW95_gp1478 [Pandoravirus inopinatum]AJF98212.1 hypothetical protein [Pandoravirus inopinatum]
MYGVNTGASSGDEKRQAPFATNRVVPSSRSNSALCRNPKERERETVAWVGEWLRLQALLPRASFLSFSLSFFHCSWAAGAHDDSERTTRRDSPALSLCC